MSGLPDSTETLWVVPAKPARLRQNATICTRLGELRKAVTATVVQLAITKRAERLIALQDRWDALRHAKAALAAQDYAPAMKTGVVTDFSDSMMAVLISYSSTS